MTIGGVRIDRTDGIALTATASDVWLEPRCFETSASYTIEGNRFVGMPPAPRFPGDGRETLRPCERKLPARTERVMLVIGTANMIERIAGQGLRISGEDGSLTLSSQ